MCTRPAHFQEIGQRYPGFIADLLGGMNRTLCWLFFARMSTTVTGPPIPYDVGGELQRQERERHKQGEQQLLLRLVCPWSHECGCVLRIR